MTNVKEGRDFLIETLERVAWLADDWHGSCEDPKFNKLFDAFIERNHFNERHENGPFHYDLRSEAEIATMIQEVTLIFYKRAGT